MSKQVMKWIRLQVLNSLVGISGKAIEPIPELSWRGWKCRDDRQFAIFEKLLRTPLIRLEKYSTRSSEGIYIQREQWYEQALRGSHKRGPSRDAKASRWTPDNSTKPISWIMLDWVSRKWISSSPLAKHFNLCVNFAYRQKQKQNTADANSTVYHSIS